MAIPSFYFPQLALHDQLISLDSNEASHAVKSRRLRVGQEVRVFNGRGLVSIGNLSVVERREVAVKLNAISEIAPTQRRISIAVAIPKGDRQKVMIDMLTQLGVFEIIPLRCERSVTQFSDNTSDKWKRIAIEACKQSQNPWLPKIADELGFDELLESGGRRFAFAHIGDALVFNTAESFSELTVLIGPEGGFSAAELAKLTQQSIPSISIGRYILRTEAAAVAVASTLVA